MAGEFRIKNGAIVVPLAGNENEIVIVDADGKLLNSGSTIPELMDISNVLIVDSYAPSGEGERGFLNKRFDDIHEAVEASEKGDLIIVLPGTYYLRNQISQNIAKPGLSMHFMSGTIVYFGYTPFNSTAQQWIDGNGNENFRCTGYARFIAYSDGVFKRFVTASQNGPLDWYIECESIDTDTQLVASSTGPLDEDGDVISSFNEGTSIFVQDVGGNSNKTIINVHGFMNLRKQAVLFQAQNSGTLCLTVCGDIITHEEAYSIDMRHARCYVKCRNLISAATDSAIRTSGLGGTKSVINVEDTISCSAGNVLKFAHSGTYEIKAKTISSSSAEAIIMSSNTTVRIDGARIITTSASHNAIQRNTTGGSLRLVNCSLESAGTYSLGTTSASTNVILDTFTYANKIKMDEVNTQGVGLYAVDTYEADFKIGSYDLTVGGLAGNTNELVTLDSNGKFLTSGININTINNRVFYGINDINSTTTIDDIAISGNNGSIDYLLKIINSTNSRTSKLTVDYSPSGVNFTEYAIIDTNGPINDAFWEVLESSGDVILRLVVTSGTYDIKVFREHLV